MRTSLCKGLALSSAVMVGLSLTSCGDKNKSEESSPGAGGSLADAGGVASPPPSDAAPPVVVTVAKRAVCSTGGWCWEGPSGQTNHLRALAVNSSTDVWVVGDVGTLLHFDGTAWQGHSPEAQGALTSVWSSGADDVWVAGEESLLMHYDGEVWTQETELGLPEGSALHAVWGDSLGKVWAAGTEGILLELTDGVWTRVELDVGVSLNAIWGTGGEAWVVGNEGTLLHYESGQWAQEESGSGRDLYAIHGGEDSLWFAGASGEVRSWNSEDERWDTMGGQGPRPTGILRSLRVADGGQIYAAGDSGQVYHWDSELLCPAEGDAGAPLEPCPDWVQPLGSGQELGLHALWSEGQSLMTVGDFGLTVKWEGEVRTVLAAGAVNNYLGVSGTESGDLWVAGDRLLHRESGTWQQVSRDSARAAYAVQALPDGGVLVAGTGGMARRLLDEDWQSLDVPPSAWLRGLSSNGTSGWLVGSRGDAWGLLNGSLWTQLETPTNVDLLGVWSLPGGATWAVGEQGVVLRHDGVLWAEVPSGPNGGVDADLRAVWSLADDNAWAVGTGNTILHYDGLRWTQASESGSTSLNAVWGLSANDIWVVGSGGTILHYDGVEWSQQHSGTRYALNGVWGTESELVVVGERETLLIKHLQ